MARRGARGATYACAGAVLGLVMPLVATPSAGAATSVTTTGAVQRASRSTESVPAYAGAQRLKARIPSGGLVSYRLPTLPAGGTRLLGDWDGDGAETSGTFVDGQWQLSDRMVRVSGPRTTVTFGLAGDRPVTGDWNGDGVTDLGLVRGSEWLLTLGPVPTDGSPPVIWRDVTFGDPTDVPVTGDWDGDGTTGLGMVQGRRWLLAPSVDRLAAAASVSYGAPGDKPVVGDWDGDGADGLGVVRGTSWYLSNTTGRPKAAITSTLADAAGDVPLAWRVPVVPGVATCPTRMRAARGDAHWVVPSPALDRDVRPLPDRATRRVRGSLEEAERYLLGAQYDARWRATRRHSYLGLLGGGTDELAIRLPAMSALTVAIGLRTGAADPTRIGRSTTQATAYVSQLVRSIACSHEAVSPAGWGRGWETAHWAMLTGAAAWLIWDQLSVETRSDVVAMVAAEADRLVDLAVPYWALPDGTVVTPGDTKAEECAWNVGLLSLAAAMMPSAPHAALWRAKAATLAVAAYSVPADLTSPTLVNGVSLQDRLSGYNAYADGTVENHDRIHPDYAANIQLLWLSADFDRLARQRVPEAMFHDGGLVYSALSTRSFQAGAPSPAGGTFFEPGGTSYVPGTNTVYYPQGDDWGLVRRAHFVSLDAHALVYGSYLGATGWSAAAALARHEAGQRALVASSGATDGRTYSVDPAVAAQQDTYPGREEYAAQSLASAWLALYVRQIGVPRLDTGLLPVPVATAKAPRAPASAGSLAP
jgi:hypothetical protein